MIVNTPLIDSIPLKEHTFISFTGGGGKTTLVKELSKVYRSMGKSVLITTTVKIQSPEAFDWDSDFVYTDSSILSFMSQRPCTVLFANRSDIEGKLVSPSFEILEELKSRFDIVLCEADGSRHLPIKIHTDRDPVIASFSDWTVCIAGSWAFGKKADEFTFGLPDDLKGRIVDLSFLDWYLNDEEGLLKRSKKNKRSIVLTGSENLEDEYLSFFEILDEKVFLR